MRVLVFHNPVAGHAQRSPESLIVELQRAGHDVAWQPAADPLPADVGERFDLIVAAGGDGSVGRAGRQLIGSGLPMVTLPLGTANNLGAALGAGPDDLVRRIEDWRPRPFDVGALSGLEETRHFLEGVGIGAFAAAAAALTDIGAVAPPFGVDDELSRDRRRLAREIRTGPALPLEIEIDGQTVAGRVVLAEVLNIGAIGPRVHLAPDADPADGRLDVVLVRDDQREALAAVLDGCEAGEPCRSPLPVQRATRVALTVPEGTRLHLDGKTMPAPARRLEIDVRAGALTILRGALATDPAAPDDGEPDSFRLPPGRPPGGSPPLPRRNPWS